MSAMRSNLSVTRDAAVLDLCEEEPGRGVEDCKHLASNNSIVLYSIYSIVKESVVQYRNYDSIGAIVCNSNDDSDDDDEEEKEEEEENEMTNPTYEMTVMMMRRRMR